MFIYMCSCMPVCVCVVVVGRGGCHEVKESEISSVPFLTLEQKDGLFTEDFDQGVVQFNFLQLGQ